MTMRSLWEIADGLKGGCTHSVEEGKCSRCCDCTECQQIRELDALGIMEAEVLTDADVDEFLRSVDEIKS